MLEIPFNQQVRINNLLVAVIVFPAHIEDCSGYKTTRIMIRDEYFVLVINIVPEI
jgi:hypothetical protein